MNDPMYFVLPVSGEAISIYRERVYCYELYHHLRQILEHEVTFRYALHGEVDKTKHPIIANRCGKRIPDFLVHIPGEMGHNLAVIEVKPVTAPQWKLRGDVKKLTCFIDGASYYRGILLIYGDGTGEPPRPTEATMDEIADTPIILMWHRGPRTPIETLIPNQDRG